MQWPQNLQMKQKLHGTNIQQSVSGKPDVGERHPHDKRLTKDLYSE